MEFASADIVGRIVRELPEVGVDARAELPGQQHTVNPAHPARQRIVLLHAAIEVPLGPVGYIYPVGLDDTTEILDPLGIVLKIYLVGVERQPKFLRQEGRNLGYERQEDSLVGVDWTKMRSSTYLP